MLVSGRPLKYCTDGTSTHRRWVSAYRSRRKPRRVPAACGYESRSSDRDLGMAISNARTMMHQVCFEHILTRAEV